MNYNHDTQVGGNHYNQGNLPQHWDLSIMYQWDPFQYQITKYVMRWKDKHPTPEKKLEDLKKARSFLDKYIAEYEAFLPKAAEVPTPLPQIMPSMLAEQDEHFQVEGYDGNRGTLYRCRKCGEHVLTADLLQAHLEHGSCAEPTGYIQQG